jgi:hypothetical protein
MLKMYFVKPDDITRQEKDFFWDQDIDMDDWDYMLLLPLDTEVTKYVSEYDRVVIEPISYEITRLLTGCCSNKWRYGTFRGDKYLIGIAYHS